MSMGSALICFSEWQRTIFSKAFSKYNDQIATYGFDSIQMTRKKRLQSAIGFEVSMFTVLTTPRPESKRKWNEQGELSYKESFNEGFGNH